MDCFDPHEPWDPPSPYRELYDPDYSGQEIVDPVPGPTEGYMTEEEIQHTKALYAGEITFVDKWIGILIDRMKALGLYKNSLIMFTSDHGEPFGEHGFIRKAYPLNYEELAHIPWIVHHPQGWGAGQRYSSFVQPPDMMPTILKALNIPLEDLDLDYLAPVELTFPQDIAVMKTPIKLTGASLLPILKGEMDSVRDFAVTAHCCASAQWCLRTKEWMYQFDVTGSRKPELYNRRKDPGEKANVLEKHQEIGAMMKNNWWILQNILKKLRPRTAR